MDDISLNFMEEPTASPSDMHDSNLLRDKTFTPELRDLVKRATEKEPAVQGAGDEDDLDSLSKEELIRRFYKLFYLARNLEDNLEINSSFNPMDLPEDTGRDRTYAVAEYIKKQLIRYGIPSYAILSYSISDGAFVPSYSNLTAGGENIAIGLHDTLYKTILSADDGIIINVGEMLGDIYIEKQFALTDSETTSIYLAPLSSFMNALTEEMSFLDHSVPVLPSSLILITLTEKRTLTDAESISKMIRRQLVVPLFLFEISRRSLLGPPTECGLEDQSMKCARIIHLALSQHGRVGAVISYSNNDSPENYYIFRYCLSTIIAALSSINLIIHPVSTRAFISFDTADVDAFNAILDHDTFATGIGISAKLFQGLERLKYNDIISEIFAPL